MQPPGVRAEIVHRGHRRAQLEPQRRIVAQRAADLGDAFGLDVQGQFAAVHDDAFDRVVELAERLFERVHDLV